MIKFILPFLLSSAACGLAQTEPATAQSATAQPATAQSPTAQSLDDRVTPSLVAVQFNLSYEFGRVEFVGPGVVVSNDGMILLPGDIISEQFPDEQLKDFKIIVPQFDKDNEEIDAEFLGRDERNDVAFVKAKPDPSHTGKPHTWTPIKFVDEPLPVGQPLFAVGLLAKSAGYRSFLTGAIVSAHIRGEIPQILVSGALANVGAPVFDADGNAVGLVNSALYEPYLSRSGGRQEINALSPTITPPHLFTPTAEFAGGITDPPKPGVDPKIPWVGLPAMVGVTKDVADAFGLSNQPAIQIGTIAPDTPAAAAGLKVRQIIVKINGQPLPRADEPEELPQILHRLLIRMHTGDQVTFSVIDGKDQPPHDVTVTLGERPERPNTVKRFYADDLGFGVRQITFDDTFRRKQPASFPGVVVTVLKPSGAAANAKLMHDDVVTQLNNSPVTTLDAFINDYQSLRKDKPNEAIVLVVMKPDATTQTIRIEPPQ